MMLSWHDLRQSSSSSCSSHSQEKPRLQHSASTIWNPRITVPMANVFGSSVLKAMQTRPAYISGIVKSDCLAAGCAALDPNQCAPAVSHEPLYIRKKESVRLHKQMLPQLKLPLQLPSPPHSQPSTAFPSALASMKRSPRSLFQSSRVQYHFDLVMNGKQMKANRPKVSKFRAPAARSSNMSQPKNQLAPSSLLDMRQRHSPLLDSPLVFRWPIYCRDNVIHSRNSRAPPLSGWHQCPDSGPCKGVHG